MEQINSSHWLEMYQAAVMEADNEKLPWRIGLAIDAMDERVRFLANTPNGSVEEKRKLDDAFGNLRNLLKAGAA
jgi:hypothetical protein